MKKLFFLFSFALGIFFSKTALCQDVVDTPIVHDLTPKVYKNFLINGRIIGANLENVQGVSITNNRTLEKANTDSRGVYQINAAKWDTLSFNVTKYSRDTMVVRSVKDNLNLIMFKRKVDQLPANYSQSDFDKANKEDSDFHRILEKDAKLEGKWKY